jgi:hypothetical protein
MLNLSDPSNVAVSPRMQLVQMWLHKPLLRTKYLEVHADIHTYLGR